MGLDLLYNSGLDSGASIWDRGRVGKVLGLDSEITIG